MLSERGTAQVRAPPYLSAPVPRFRRISALDPYAIISAARFEPYSGTPGWFVENAGLVSRPAGEPQDSKAPRLAASLISWNPGLRAGRSSAGGWAEVPAECEGHAAAAVPALARRSLLPALERRPRDDRVDVLRPGFGRRGAFSF